MTTYYESQRPVPWEDAHGRMRFREEAVSGLEIGLMLLLLLSIFGVSGWYIEAHLDVITSLAPRDRALLALAAFGFLSFIPMLLYMMWGMLFPPELVIDNNGIHCGGAQSIVWREIDAIILRESTTGEADILMTRHVMVLGAKGQRLSFASYPISPPALAQYLVARKNKACPAQNITLTEDAYCRPRAVQRVLH